MAATEHKGKPIVEFADPAAWEAWLEANHAESEGVWLKFAKKGSGRSTVNHAQALEVALCFGWIDGQLAKSDDAYFLQRFTRRGPRSRWSQVNCQAADGLIASGRMRSAGLSQVQAAQADGRWEAAYEPQSRATVPPDFQEALDAAPEAKAFFETLKGPKRYAFLYRLTTVKRPDTRAKRIVLYVEMLRRGETYYDD